MNPFVRDDYHHDFSVTAKVLWMICITEEQKLPIDVHILLKALTRRVEKSPCELFKSKVIRASGKLISTSTVNSSYQKR